MNTSETNQLLKANKFIAVRGLLAEWAGRSGIAKPTLLDIGCRDCILKRFLPDTFAYSGLDLVQNVDNTVTHVGRFPGDMRFPDKSFDVTCALDCLEHMDDIQTGLEEMLKITGKMALVVLPNMAHVVHRLRFFVSGRISGKYDLLPGMGPDRHRWLTTLHQSDAFVKEVARQLGFSCTVMHIRENAGVIGFTGYILSELLRFLNPQWTAWSSLYQLVRTQD